MNGNGESLMVAAPLPDDGFCEETTTNFDLPTVEQPTDIQQQQQLQQTPNIEVEQETQFSQLDGKNEAVEDDRSRDFVNSHAQSLFVQHDSVAQPPPLPLPVQHDGVSQPPPLPLPGQSDSVSQSSLLQSRSHPLHPPLIPQHLPPPPYSQPLPSMSNLPVNGFPEQQQLPQPPPPPYMPQPYGYNGYDHHFYPPQPFYFPPQGPGTYHQYPKAYYQLQGNYQNNRKNRNNWNNESMNKNIVNESNDKGTSQNEDIQSQIGQAIESNGHTRNNSRDSNGGYRGRGRGRGRDRGRGRQRRDGGRSFGYYSNQANPHFYGQNGYYNGYQGYNMDNQGYYGMGYPGGPMGPYPPMDYMGYGMMGGYPIQTPPPYQPPAYGGMESQNNHQMNYGNTPALENGIKELSMHSGSYQDQGSEGVVVVGTRNNTDNFKKGIGVAVKNKEKTSGNIVEVDEIDDKEGQEESGEVEKAKPTQRIVPGLNEEDNTPQGKLSKSQAKRLRKKMRDQGQPKE